MALEIARASWDDEHQRQIVGRNKQYELASFSKSDLTGSVNLIVDYNSLFPKSQATERATIAQLVQLGIVNPLDPEMQWKVLEKFGETELKGSVDLDVKQAVKEQEKFMADETYQPSVVPLIQNSTVHLMTHSDFTKTDEFTQLPPQRQQDFIAHIQVHFQDLQMRQGAFGQPGGGPPPTGAAPGVPPDGSQPNTQGADAQMPPAGGDQGVRGIQQPRPVSPEQTQEPLQ